jgi:hypothetical protein
MSWIYEISGYIQVNLRVFRLILTCYEINNKINFKWPLILITIKFKYEIIKYSSYKDIGKPRSLPLIISCETHCSYNLFFSIGGHSDLLTLFSWKVKGKLACFPEGFKPWLLLWVASLFCDCFIWTAHDPDADTAGPWARLDRSFAPYAASPTTYPLKPLGIWAS